MVDIIVLVCLSVAKDGAEESPLAGRKSGGEGI
jgi:hypothetical protein